MSFALPGGVISSITSGLAAQKAHQTKTLITASLNGWSGTIEKISPATIGRHKPPIAGLDPLRNLIAFIDNPVTTWDEITLSVVATKSDAFIKEAQALYAAHRQNPSAAGVLTIRSHHDDGSIATTITYVQAVIQKVKMPEGDTETHGAAIAEIVVQPRGVTG
jgi:hypothetical protein